MKFFLLVLIVFQLAVVLGLKPYPWDAPFATVNVVNYAVIVIWAIFFIIAVRADV